jgi:fructoselysine-6-P-deglycase FrlB-like protein
VGTSSACGHSLVVYKTSARADDKLRRLWRGAREQGRRVTVLALAAEEGTSSGCCDTRSVLWNQICRDMAREDLARAAQVVERDPEVAFGVLVARSGRAPETLAGEALARGADEIVLADPRKSGLGRLELRRLRRSSPVPVA